MMIFMTNLPISSVFYMKNNFWTKISQNGHCAMSKKFCSSSKKSEPVQNSFGPAEVRGINAYLIFFSLESQNVLTLASWKLQLLFSIKMGIFLLYEPV